MSRKRSPLPVEVLSFLLATLLGIAIGNLSNNPGALPAGLEFVRRHPLPLAGITILSIIGVMIWKRRAEERSAHPVWDSDRSPFPGLEAFTERDSAVFFGRDAEITELLERLQPVVAGRANRLIAVVGPSGAGKSSLVQAGVVPRLRRRRSNWLVVPPVLPGDHPLRSLARSLEAAGSASDGTPAARFADEVRTAARRPNAPVLVIVDQAEELITLSGPAERDAFLGLLAAALDADPRLWIIMIMRSEFLTAFLGTAQARLFRDPVAVGTLGPAALVEVIEQPARRAGLSFDPPTLPQRMATEAGGGDALPLLAYALQELCLTVGRGGTLTADSYERLGGVTGVLTRQADKVAAELGDTDGLVLSTLLKFVTIGENEPTRRRVPRSALTDAQWRIAEAFIAARLLTSAADGEDVILEVAHEALFQHWGPLLQAIETSADQLRWRADLERWARDWDNSGRQAAYLLRDERLKAAQRWATSDGNVVDGLALASEFLDCSNRADRAAMERLSETIARQALASVDRDPDYSLLLALAAYEECAPTTLAVRSLTAALVASPGGVCDPCSRRPPDVAERLREAGFFTREPIRRALAAYDFGYLFRAVRRTAELTQVEFGEVLELDQDRISRIERGERQLKDFETIVRVASRLGIPLTLLGFSTATMSVAARSAALAHEVHSEPAPGARSPNLPPDNGGADSLFTELTCYPCITSEMSHTGDKGIAECSEEQTEGSKGPLVFSEQDVSLGLRAGKVASPYRRDPIKHSVIFSALGFDELRHLGAAFDDARRYFDIEVVGYFKKQLNNCAANDGAHGPARALPPALGIVAAIEIHAREVKADVRRELLTVGAQAAEFVGWLYRDARQPRLSGHWQDRAMEWAQEAGDLPMQGYLLLKKSQAAWDERDGLRMLTLAQAANDGPWQLPPLVRAEVTQQEARGLAMTGESSVVVDAKLNEAWEVFTAAETTASELGCHYDRALLAMQTAICYCEAGRPGQAAQVYREHLNDEQISRRDRGYFLSLTASAWTQAAEPDNAASTGQEALTIAVETYSLRTIHELKRVCVLLEPWRSQPAVRDLRDAVLPL